MLRGTVLLIGLLGVLFVFGCTPVFQINDNLPQDTLNDLVAPQFDVIAAITPFLGNWVGTVNDPLLQSGEISLNLSFKILVKKTKRVVLKRLPKVQVIPAKKYKVPEIRFKPYDRLFEGSILGFLPNDPNTIEFSYSNDLIDPGFNGQRAVISTHLTQPA